MSNLIQLAILEEVVKAINEHATYGMGASLTRNGHIFIEYSEQVGKSVFATKSFNVTLKPEF
jgi:hypothetical protein